MCVWCEPISQRATRSVNTSFFRYRTEALGETSWPLRGCWRKYFQAEVWSRALRGSLEQWFVAEVSLTSRHILNMSVYYSVTVVNWSISGQGVLPVKITKLSCQASLCFFHLLSHCVVCLFTGCFSFMPAFPAQTSPVFFHFFFLRSFTVFFRVPHPTNKWVL